MSDPGAVPDEERPFIPEEEVPRREGDDDPIRADATRRAENAEEAEGAERTGEDSDDDSIDVEDLP